MAYMFYFASCMNITFNSLLTQLVKYDVHTTRKIKFIHAIIYHVLLLSARTARVASTSTAFTRRWWRRVLTLELLTPQTGSVDWLPTCSLPLDMTSVASS